MDALETLMWPVVRLINRQIQNKTPARELCAELDGRIIAIRVRDTALALYFRVRNNALEAGNFDDDPDVVISGSHHSDHTHVTDRVHFVFWFINTIA